VDWIWPSQPADVSLITHAWASDTLFPGALIISGKGGRLGTSITTLPLCSVMSVRFVSSTGSADAAFRVTDAKGSSATIGLRAQGLSNNYACFLACAVILRRTLAAASVTDPLRCVDAVVARCSGAWFLMVRCLR
jgi:hypothetical protein